MKKKIAYPDFDGTQNCSGLDTEFFYQDDETMANLSQYKRNEHYEYMRKVCSTCPFLDPCFTWGIHHEKYGIWGGTTKKERELFRKKNNIIMIDPVDKQFKEMK